MTANVRTRFAPSPTGMVHIGSVQKMLFSYAWAKKNGGSYILRLEDTDQKRYVPGAEKAIYKAHQKLGLEFDEEYRQSERLEIYKEWVEKLIAKGHAYYAFETPEELKQLREEFQVNNPKANFRYKGKWRELAHTDPEVKQKLAEGVTHVVRIRIPETLSGTKQADSVSFRDKIMGQITVKLEELDDYVLIKSDGFPTYHFANVVDDHLMQISHVFRGVEWLATAPVHVLLYQMFAWEMPEFVHIPNILDPKGGKLSKRSGSVALDDFFANGYLADAINNFMMLLGWAPEDNQEVFTLEEFCEKFELERLNKSNPVFNRDKLLWFNGQYLRSLSPENLSEKLSDWAEEYDSTAQERLEQLKDKLGKSAFLEGLKLEQERTELLSELPEKLELFLRLPEELDFSHKQTKKLTSHELKSILQSYLEFIEDKSPQDHESWEAGVRRIVSNLGLKPGNVFMTIRIAVTGAAQSPPIFEFSQVIGEEEQKSRIEQALEQVSN